MLFKSTQRNGNPRWIPKNRISSSLVETGQTNNNDNFKYGSETLPIVDKQTYLGIEMTSLGCYSYARDILSKKAYKVLATVKRLFSNSDTTTITIMNKLVDALVKPILLYGCEIWGPELLSYKTHFDKSTIEQVHIKFCKQTQNTPWYTENIHEFTQQDG